MQPEKGNGLTWSTVFVSGVGNSRVPDTTLTGIGSHRVVTRPVRVTFVCPVRTFINVCTVQPISTEPRVTGTGIGPFSVVTGRIGVTVVDI